jgi:hypothetical protein
MVKSIGPSCQAYSGFVPALTVLIVQYVCVCVCVCVFVCVCKLWEGKLQCGKGCDRNIQKNNTEG